MARGRLAAQLGCTIETIRYYERQPMRALTGVACAAGMLGVSLQPWARPLFGDLLTWLGSYHDFDYHLFHMNIRQNAIDRAAASLAHRRDQRNP